MRMGIPPYIEKRNVGFRDGKNQKTKKIKRKREKTINMYGFSAVKEFLNSSNH